MIFQRGMSSLMKTKHKTTHAGGAARATLLLVDDDVSIRVMLTRVLTGEGYLVLSASTGAEAVGIASVNKIDLRVVGLEYAGAGRLGHV